MADPIFSDDAMRAARFALDGLERRQEMIGQNLANVDTPGFQARSLNFEDALLRAIDRPQKNGLVLTNSSHLEPQAETLQARTVIRPGGGWRTDGNNVDIETELTEMAETGIRYQALTQLISKKFLLLRAIGTGR